MKGCSMKGDVMKICSMKGDVTKYYLTEDMMLDDMDHNGRPSQGAGQEMLKVYISLVSYFCLTK